MRGIWHPFGVDGASLTVLTSDAVVRLYDFTMHLESTFEVPDQIFDLNALSGRERHRTSFMPDPESFEPASCCFASGDLSWRPFTLYILMRGGDIYALCPIVPSRWLPSENYLYSLERELSFQLESLGTSTDVTRDDRLALRDQTRWLEEVMNQEAAKRALNGRKKQDWFTRPESIGPTPKLQGPFLLQPAPVDVSADEVYACDILHITAEPFATICAVWSNTNIDVFLEFEPIQARWVGKKLRQKQLEEDKNPPIIGAFETVTIGAPLPQNHARKHWPLFVENPLISEVVFVAHHAGIEAVDLSEWLKGLKQVVDPDEGEEFIAKQIARTTGSTKKKIVNSGGTLPHLPHSIDGCVVLQDSYVGYILIASSCRMVYPTDFDIPFELRNVGGIGDTLSSVKPTRVSQQLPGYIPSIAQPLYDPSAILRAPTSLQHFIQANLSRNPNLMKGRLNYNAETLEILRQGREQVKREYETVTTVAEALYTRAKQQRIEYERQLLKIHELITRQESFEAGNVKGRLDRALKEQQALVGRADALMRLLVRKGLGGSGEATGVVKSEREREWELELEKLVKKTGFVEGKGKEKDEDYTEKSGLEKRVEQVRDILEEMKPLVEKGSGENEGAGGAQDRGDGVPEELRKKKVGELNEMLDKEYVSIPSPTYPLIHLISQKILIANELLRSFLINATKAKLERLETKCEEMRL